MGNSNTQQMNKRSCREGASEECLALDEDAIWDFFFLFWDFCL